MGLTVRPFHFHLIRIGWELYLRDEDKFDLFFTRVIDLLLSESLTIEELPLYVSFFKYAFRVRIPLLA